MSNVKINSISINASKHEWALTGAQLVEDSNKAFYEEIVSLGEGKGIAFAFKANEHVTFPKFEEMIFVKRTTTFHGKEYALLYVYGSSDFRGDVEVPLSIFRRVPGLEEDQAAFFKDSPLTEQLAQSQLGDLGRARILSDHTIVVDEGKKYLRQTFTTTPQSTTRDSEEIIRKKKETLTCYRVSFK